MIVSPKALFDYGKAAPATNDVCKLVAYGLDIDPITNRVYVASTALNLLSVVDGKTNTTTATITNVPATFVAVNFISSKVYVSGGNSLTVLTEK